MKELILYFEKAPDRNYTKVIKFYLSEGQLFIIYLNKEMEVLTATWQLASITGFVVV